ncbi:helix-turn-helix domain-containing protein [Histidinibacterium lentulum]|uniref:XRE family transcriptional regulator n=1 Tax=Histidinibacterium lentulum TaxID=2480588 RepID=A0A3N2QTT9_9RHOB|nr:helix-turn-helix transcriptional regulator [Histidinibacterium lentulum]ROT98618.1 XRE family transcriptional regulator [Histidinibacterium lentulum]
MPARQFTGSRIRERRLMQGLRQSDLARMAGISPSYLNLIEHNRRRIAGRLLSDIARALDVDPQSLAEGAEAAKVEALRRAAARPETGAVQARPAELDRVDEFAGRFPGWADLVVTQERRMTALEDRLRGLSDRLAHDPQLAEALHEVISAVTSIRSTSAILTGEEEIDADWQRRFHQNIFDDAQRLAESSKALVSYLDATSGERAVPLSATEEADALFADAGGGPVPALEREGQAAVDRLVAEAETLVSDGGRALARARLLRYAEDAEALPLAEFGPLAAAARHDPVDLARQTGAPLDRVMRRLAALPPEDGHPVTGLAICDSAGVVSAMQPLAGIDLPRAGGSCPFWPLFEALGQPGRPIRACVILPGAHDTPLLAHAVALPKIAPDYGTPLVQEATMIFRAATPAERGASPPRPVGVACRICPRTDCGARREPSILSATSAPAK